MKICVAIKQLQDGSINPFDEIALEAALRFREDPGSYGLPHVAQIIVASVGPPECDNSLRTALAMGADQAFRVAANANLEPRLIGKCLAVMNRQEQTQLILMGRQAVDHDHQQTGQITAARLGWGQAIAASEIRFAEDFTTKRMAALVLREVDHGLERWSIALPAVITVDLRLNNIHESGGARYASLPNIMKARRKPLQTLTTEMLGVDTSAQLRCLGLHPPKERPAGKRVANVEQLLFELDHAGLI